MVYTNVNVISNGLLGASIMAEKVYKNQRMEDRHIGRKPVVQAFRAKEFGMI